MTDVLEIGFAVRDPKTETFFAFTDTYAEATDNAQYPDDEIWLTVHDGAETLLPDTFNRRVITEQGDELLSAVLSRRELVPLDGHEWTPLDGFPTLVIDRRTATVSWETDTIEQVWPWERRSNQT